MLLRRVFQIKSMILLYKWSVLRMQTSINECFSKGMRYLCEAMKWETVFLKENRNMNLSPIIKPIIFHENNSNIKGWIE